MNGYENCLVMNPTCSLSSFHLDDHNGTRWIDEETFRSVQSGSKGKRVNRKKAENWKTFSCVRLDTQSSLRWYSPTSVCVCVCQCAFSLLELSRKRNGERLWSTAGWKKGRDKKGKEGGVQGGFVRWMEARVGREK